MKKKMGLKIMVLLFAFFALVPVVFSSHAVFALERKSPVMYSSDKKDNKDSKDKDDDEEDDDGDIGGLNVSMDEDGDGITIEGLDTDDDTWTTIFKKYKKIILGFSGIATLTFVAFFIKNFLSVGANSDNPQARSAAIKGCLWTGIATAACGSIMIVVGLFWNALK